MRVLLSAVRVLLTVAGVLFAIACAAYVVGHLDTWFGIDVASWGFLFLLAGAVILLLLFVKVGWLVFHRRTHVSLALGILALSSMFVPVLGWLLFATLALFAVNPWSIDNVIARVIASFSPSRVRDLIDHQVIAGAPAGEAGDWFRTHWSGKDAAGRERLVSDHWARINQEMVRGAKLSPIKREVFCDWARCLRTAYLHDVGRLI